MLNRIRNSPALLALVAFVALAVVVFAWWTISPLFIRTTLNEGQDVAIPVAQATATPAAMVADATATHEAMQADKMRAGATATHEAMMAQVTATPVAMMPDATATHEAMQADKMRAEATATHEAMMADSMMAEATATPEPVMPAPTATPEAMMSGPQVLAVGNFDHKDNIHYADGQAILLRQEDGSYAVRLQDLAAANGPDLFVYVTEHPDPMNGDEVHQGGYNLGALKATNGSFSYTLDPAIDPAKIKTVTIYCRAFSVIFSVAQLAPSGG